MSDSIHADPSLPHVRQPIPRSVWALGCLGTLVLVVGLGSLSIWLYFRGRHQQAARAVQAEVDRIHAAGEPITVEDMFAHHRVPEGSFDPTPLWMEAIKAAASIKDPSQPQLPIVGDGKLANLQADAPQSHLPLAEKFLAAHGATIDKTRTAAAAGSKCHYPVDFSQGFNALLPHIQDARGLARVLSLRLHVAVENGDVATAVESLKLELALAETMDHEPTLISQLVRMAVLGIAFRDLREMVGNLPLTETELARLQTMVAAIDPQRPVKEGLLGERAMGFHTFHHLSQMEGVEILAGKDGTMQRPGDLRVYLGLMRELIEAADESPAQARLTAARVENRLKGMVGKTNPLDKLETVITTLIMPGTGQVFEASARTQALRDSAVCGIAFRRYQLAHGSPPDSLAALVPEFLPAVPQDPFDPAGTPLTLDVDGDQYAIYSIGADGRDNRELLSDPDSTNDNGFVAPLAVPNSGVPTSPAAGDR